MQLSGVQGRRLVARRRTQRAGTLGAGKGARKAGEKAGVGVSKRTRL